MKRIIINLTVIIFSVCISLALVEILLRIAQIDYPNFQAYDHTLGYRLSPGMSGWYSEEGGSYVTINSDGLRDKEHAVMKPPHTYRIAILGDSFAEAMHVKLADTFWSVLERELQDCQGFSRKKVEVINFGVSGYGTGQELLLLRQKVWKYSPDLVILAFFTQNDVTDNKKELAHLFGGFELLVPFFYLEDDKIMVDNSFRDKNTLYKKTQKIYWRIYYTARRHLHIVRLISYVKNYLVYEIHLDRRVSQHLDQTFWEIYVEPEDPIWKAAWSVTEQLIKQMSEEIKDKGAQFLVVILSNAIQVHPDHTVRQAFMKKYNVKNLFYPDQHLQQFCRQQGIDTLALAPIFQRLAVEQGVYLHGFKNALMGLGHWNERGHHLAGKIIAEKVCSTVK